LSASEKGLNISKASKKSKPSAKSVSVPKTHYDWNVTEAELIDGLDEDLRDA
jgi:hypothetical protein